MSCTLAHLSNTRLLHTGCRAPRSQSLKRPISLAPATKAWKQSQKPVETWLEPIWALSASPQAPPEPRSVLTSHTFKDLASNRRAATGCLSLRFASLCKTALGYRQPTVHSNDCPASTRAKIPAHAHCPRVYRTQVERARLRLRWPCVQSARHGTRSASWRVGMALCYLAPTNSRLASSQTATCC